MPATPPPPAPDETPPTQFDVTVEEFCARQSETEKRIELLAAFYSDEVRHGRFKDSCSAFESRLTAFANRPA